MKLIKLLPFCALCRAGCSHMYTLPDPPPQAEWVEVNQKQEDPEVVAKRAIDAKRAIIQCYAALVSKKYERALELLSNDTVSALEAASDSQNAAEALASEYLTIDGQKQPFDSIGDVFINGLTDIRDVFGERKDNEGPSRHVYYAVDANGNAREIVVILEDDQWRIHRPQIFSPILAP